MSSSFVRKGATVVASSAIALGLVAAGFVAPAQALINADSDASVVGYGDQSASYIANLPSAIGDHKVLDIAVGNQASYVLRDDNTVTTTWPSSADPAGYKLLAALNDQFDGRDVVDLEASYTGTFALLDDGTLVADPSTQGGAGFAAATDGQHFDAVSAGRHFALGLTDDGTVRGWGDSTGTAANGTEGVELIAAGYTHAIGYTTNGALVGWGNNSSGQLTFAGATDVIHGRAVTSLAAGLGISIALLEDGAVVVWGNAGSAYTQAIATALDTHDAVAVDASNSQVFVTVDDGRVLAFEQNPNGNQNLATEIAELTDGRRAVAVVGGDIHTLFAFATPTVTFASNGESVDDVVLSANDSIAIAGAGLLGGVAYEVRWDETQVSTGTTSLSGVIDDEADVTVALSKGAHVLTVTVGDNEFTQSVTVGTGLTAATPTISGTARVGEELTAVKGAWSTGTAFTYAWLRNGKAISGATSATYTLTSADVATQIQVKVTGTKQGFAATSKTSVKTAKVAAGTLTVGDVWISGDNVVGETLTANAEGWSPVTPKVSYQWYANGKAISKATKSTYVIPGTLADKAISLRVTGALKGYTTVSGSDGGNEFVERAQLQLDDYFVAGAPAVGKTLTITRANEGIQTASVTLEYQWMRNNEPIDGATKSTYKATKADVGSYVYARIYGSRTGYVPVAMTSYYVQIYAAQVKPGTVKITGTPKVGKTLTVTIAGGDPQADVVYIWTKTKGSTTSGLAYMEPTYTIQPEDKGYTIAVQAYFSKSGFASTPVTSKSTKKVAG